MSPAMSLRLPLRMAVWIASAAAIAVFVVLGVRRVFYPLELDYIEGVMMDHVVRLAHGQPIYVVPTIEFVPLAYMPGFATLASLLARAFGPAFWEPRLVSFVAMCTSASLAAWIVWRETREWTVAAGACGILIAAFGITGGHFDVGRPDSLMLCLALAGLTTLRFTRGVVGAVVAALLLTLSFFTKQHGVWFAIAALFHVATNDRRRLWAFAPVLAVGCVGGYFALSAWLGPWFGFFTWEIPSHWSSIDKVRILNYVGRGLFGSLGVLSSATLLSLALPERPWRGPRGLWWWAGLGAFATGMMATLDPDAFRHVLNPTVVTLAVLGPLALALVSGAVCGGVSEDSRARRDVVLCALLLVQFLPLAYSVRDERPHPRAREALTELHRRMREYPGPVVMIYHGFYAWQAGKATAFQQIALDDIVRARGNRLLRDDPGFMDRLFAPLVDGTLRPMIITDVALELSGMESNPWWRKVAPRYRLAGELGWISSALKPVNGNQWTPKYVYLPIDSVAAGVRAGVAARGAAEVTGGPPGR
jgi:hypothetical protein